MFSRDFFIKALDSARERHPLVHNITNYVAMTPSANALLAIGASPLMSLEKEEIAQISKISSALVVNIGCIEERIVDAMFLAAQQAQSNGIPWVLDPVGVGVSALRSETSLELVRSCCPAVIRANASEILSLLNLFLKDAQYMDERILFLRNLSALYGKTNIPGIHTTQDDGILNRPGLLGRGVDSTIASENIIEQAKSLAEITGSIVSVSGETDYITDGSRVISISNGSPFMPQITAMGCTASAITAAFLAVSGKLEGGADACGKCTSAATNSRNEDVSSGSGRELEAAAAANTRGGDVAAASGVELEAAAAAMALMGCAGEIAHERTVAAGGGTGTFQIHFLDVLSTASPANLADRLRFEAW